MAADSSEGESLHGESAVRRQANTELLFFASVGDLLRCKKIVQSWDLEVRICQIHTKLTLPLTRSSVQPADADCCDYDKRTALYACTAQTSSKRMSMNVAHLAGTLLQQKDAIV
jgi:hypothetical protein